MTDADIEATRAPLLEHLIELRARLIRALVAFVAIFVVCFFFAKNIYNVLLIPYEHAAGPGAKLIFTSPPEYFFTQIRVAFFAAAFLGCPVIFAQLYAFVAPGLYKQERRAFAPYLFATPSLLSTRRLACLFRRPAQSLELFPQHAAGRAAGPGADRASAARQRISVADHDVDFRLRRRFPASRGLDAARPRRACRFRLFEASAALRLRAGLRRRGGADAARCLLHAGPLPFRACSSTSFRSFPSPSSRSNAPPRRRRRPAPDFEFSMHDIKWIRENPEAFDDGLRRRGLEPQVGEAARSRR